MLEKPDFLEKIREKPSSYVARKANAVI